MARAVDGVTEDRRRALRRPLGALPWLTAARLWPGRAIDVIDWSSGGMLIETNARLAPGRAVVLQLLADRGHLLINGQVARASIVTITPEAGIRCRGAVVFERSVDFCRPPERDGPKITRSP